MNPKLLLFSLLILSCFFVGCSNSAAISPAPTSEPTLTPPPSVSQLSHIQEFKGLTLVFGFVGQAAYVDAARQNPNSDLKALYEIHVDEVFWPLCSEGGEFVNPANRRNSDPIRDLDKLEQMTTTLINSDIESLVVEAYAQANRALPHSETTICLFAAEPERIFIRDRLNGVSGYAAGSGKIWLHLYPEGGWEDWVAYTVAHEHHHSVWAARHLDFNAPFRLRDYLIFEGRADSFASQLYPDLTAPWTVALSEEETQAQWENMQGQLDSTSRTLHANYMFGNEQREIPVWTGYTIGFQILQAFIEENPEVTIEEWTAMTSDDILLQSGYELEE